MGKEMRTPTFWILTALTGGAEHGYALLESVDRLSSGTVTLKVPTLYAALDRLVKEGYVEPDHEEIVNGRTRKYFRLTEDGASALKQEIQRMEDSAAAARRLLHSHPNPRFA